MNMAATRNTRSLTIRSEMGGEDVILLKHFRHLSDISQNEHSDRHDPPQFHVYFMNLV
jgi:hypothetical protein